MKRIAHLVVALTVTVPWAVSAQAWGMRCGGHLIGQGASQYSVLAKCGAPAYRDRDVQYLLIGDVRLQRQTIWYYDFGRHRFIRVLHFEDGTLTRIDLAGYGFGRYPARKCAPEQIDVGMTDYELLQTCGRPQYRQNLARVLIPAHESTVGIYVVVRTEKWTYDFGPNVFPRIITIRKGVVRSVRTGDEL